VTLRKKLALLFLFGRDVIDSFSTRLNKNISSAAFRRDLKDWSIPRDLSLDRSAWKAAIHVPEP